MANNKVKTVAAHNAERTGFADVSQNQPKRVPQMPATAQKVVAIPNQFGATKQLDPVWSAPDAVKK